MHIVSGRVKSFFAEALRHWRWYDGVNLRKFDFRVLLCRVLSGQPCQCSPRIFDIWICIIQCALVHWMHSSALQSRPKRAGAKASIQPRQNDDAVHGEKLHLLFLCLRVALWQTFAFSTNIFRLLILVHINVQFDFLLGMFAGALAAQVGRLKLRDDDVTAFAGSMCTPSSEPNTITWGFVNNIRTEAASIHMWWSVERVL